MYVSILVSVSVPRHKGYLAGLQGNAVYESTATTLASRATARRFKYVADSFAAAHFEISVLATFNQSASHR